SHALMLRVLIGGKSLILDFELVRW
ncbi:MAG: hypothetical protein QOH78_594, partial [Verrucomicrobiota bacterium]